VNLEKDVPLLLDGWHVDVLMGYVEFEGEPQKFTHQEVLYLHSIMKCGKDGIRREALFNRCADDTDETEIKIIDVLVCKLRKKMSRIDPSHTYIKTIWGIGYAWLKEAVYSASRVPRDATSSCT
jgi:DNA-binding response OmpR family regulator